MERQFDQFDYEILAAFQADPLDGVLFADIERKFHPRPTVDRIGFLIVHELVARLTATRGRITEKGQAVLAKYPRSSLPQPERLPVSDPPEALDSPATTHNPGRSAAPARRSERRQEGTGKV